MSAFFLSKKIAPSNIEEMVEIRISEFSANIFVCPKITTEHNKTA